MLKGSHKLCHNILSMRCRSECRLATFVSIEHDIACKKKQDKSNYSILTIVIPTVIVHKLARIVGIPQSSEYRFIVIAIVFTDDCFQMACSFFAVVPWNLESR
jgi:hypothetical protein